MENPQKMPNFNYGIMSTDHEFDDEMKPRKNRPIKSGGTIKKPANFEMNTQPVGQYYSTTNPRFFSPLNRSGVTTSTHNGNRTVIRYRQPMT